MDDGLPSSMVYCVLQDSKGFMWFATESGVCRFDGSKFITYTTGDGLPDNDILEMMEDSKGRIWLQTFKGVPAYIFKDSVYSFADHPEFRKLDIKSHLMSICEDSKGNIWIGTQGNGLLKISGNHVKKIVYKSAGLTERSRITHISENIRNEVIGVVGNVLINLSTGKALSKGLSLEGLPFARLLRSRDGSLFYTGQLHLVRTAEYSNDTIHLKAPFQGKDVISIDQDRTGKIWVGTMGYGAYSFKESSDTLLKEYLPGKFVSSVCRDHEGNLWFTTLTNGVFFLPFNHERFFTYKPEGVAENAFSVISDGKGRIWAGLNGAVQMVENGKTSVFSLMKGKDIQKLRRVNVMAVNSDGTLWCGAENSIIVFRDTVVVKRFDFGAKDMVTLNGNIYSGAINLSKISSGYRVKSFRWRRTNCMVVDRKGIIFLGTNQGLYKMENDSISLVEGPPELNQKIVDIKVDAAGVIYLATEGQGLLRIENGRVSRITVREGLLSNTCRTLFVDDENDLWVGTNKGINKIWFTREGIRMLSITKDDGLPSNEIKGIYKLNDSVWVASPKGLTVFREKEAKQHMAAPPYVYIGNISVWEKDTLLQDGFVLAHDQNNLRFGFKGLSYNSFGNIVYRHRIEGIDKSWVYTTQTNARYTSLPPGSYVFLVSARNKDGVWSVTPAKISFTIKKPYWETLWFRIAAVLLASGLMFLIYYYLLANMRKKTFLERRAVRSDQKAMRAQMNPHFIFNSLNAIQSFITQGDETAAHRFLSKFGKLIRLVFENSFEEFILMETELEQLRLYLDLEKVRTDNKFEYTIVIDPAISPTHLKIPSMIIQPFLENAIWHGIQPSRKPGKIVINFVMEGEHILCKVTDNGVGRKRSAELKQQNRKLHRSRGIELTRERLEIHNTNGKKYHLNFVDLVAEDGEPEGTLVLIPMPCKKI